MPTPSDPQAAALLAHVISQTQQNISFLASQGYISPADAADMTRRLSEADNASSPVEAMRNLSLSPPVAEPAPAPARRGIPPPPPRTQRARAVWAYNDDGREPNDLSFSAGEVIEIVEETNPDWWTGRCRGRQGLFPANHVEKIGGSPSPQPPAPMMPSAPMPPMAPMPPQPSYYSPPPEKSLYGPQYGGMPPPPAPMAPPPVVVVEQQPPPEQPKKHRFGKLGNTMATAAAGGFGFGAGAAVGGDIVNAIF
ncbi:SH3-domain-containing protein [Obba rivulosa]|uniref:SH3-domain-containing protein n=1 Tax=Obba rivulosa TaxID=1052685 RepID=A0A8E2DJQ6_9APHY|nr:SH3-domain-containing protein [Obba rivulosa]